MLPPLEEILNECGVLHGHLCPGQVLGARMALLGCHLSNISDPRGADRKKLIIWVEIDRCMTDALCAATGVRLGRRSLKYFDYGKVAATFYNAETGQGVRVSALDSSRELADERYSSLPNKKERQMRAYKEASDAELFKIELVRVHYGETDAPGRPLSRVTCVKCLEGVNDGREVTDREGQILCRPCAVGAYYEVIVT
jgi:formylmethanofuran dehydrogenase subunit E